MRRATVTEKATLLKRQRKLTGEVESLRPSKRRNELRLELAKLEKLLELLGYRRLD